MTIKELLQKISQQVVKQAPTKGAAAAKTPALVEKINSTFSKENVGKVAGKVAGALATANVTDALIKDVPVANNIYTWYATVVDDIYENTTRKIPVVGNFLRTISDTINKLVIPNAQKAIEQHRVNDPKFYQNLGTHIQFGIPMVYPDVVGVPFLRVLNYASIGFVKIGFNPLSSYAKEKSRYTQMLDLLKGVRGLSGQLPYAEGDLFFYDWNAKYTLTEYYRLKYALKLSHVYSLTKTSLPKQLLGKLGYDADDFIAHKANYKQILTNLHEQITVTVPTFGQLNKRIEDLLYKLIPDSNDPKVALYYCCMLYMDVLLPETSTGNYLHFTSHFRYVGIVASTSTSFEISDWLNTGVTFAQYEANYNNYIDKFPTAYKPFASIKGDLVGAFGNSVFWKDSSLKDVESTNPDDMYHSFDELFLTQLQNGTLLDWKGADLRPSNVVSDAVRSGEYISGFTLPQISLNGTALPDMMRPNAITDDCAKYEGYYTASNPEQSAGNISMPSTDGAVNISSFAVGITHETGVILNKAKLSEGESYEVLQLMAWYDSKTAGYDSGSNKDILSIRFRTHSFFLSKFDILYYDFENGTNAEMRIRPTAIYADNVITQTYSVVEELMRQSQFWSQADYGIKLPMRVEDDTRAKNYMLLDFNIMGSISESAYKISVINSAYSLYYANIKTGDNTGKRTGNIVQAYERVTGNN